MDNAKQNELLQKLKADHDKRCAHASSAKAGGNLSPSDFKIKSDHTIEEYIKKYSSDIKHGKVKAYAENELHLMSKKTTYWDIKNNTNLKYFSLPNTLKIPFIHLSSLGKIATAAAAAAVATGGTVAGILLTPKNPVEESNPDGSQYREPAAHPEHDIDNGDEIDAQNPPQERLLKMFDTVVLRNSGSLYYAIYLYFNYYNNNPDDYKDLNKLDLNEYGRYWTTYTFQFVFAPIHNFEDMENTTVFDVPSVAVPGGYLQNPLYNKTTWRDAIQAYMDSNYSSKHGQFNGYFWSDHCSIGDGDTKYYYDEEIRLEISEEDLNKNPKYNDIVGTFTIDLTKFYLSNDGGQTKISYLSTGRDIGGDITLYFYPFTTL